MRQVGRPSVEHRERCILHTSPLAILKCNPSAYTGYLLSTAVREKLGLIRRYLVSLCLQEAEKYHSSYRCFLHDGWKSVMFWHQAFTNTLNLSDPKPTTPETLEERRRCQRQRASRTCFRRCYPLTLLGGSWVVVCGVKSPLL